MPRMAWMQLRRWLSFLPPAFVLYILLHYLVYQPNLESHNSYLGSSKLGKLSVSDANHRPEHPPNGPSLIMKREDDPPTLVTNPKFRLNLNDTQSDRGTAREQHQIYVSSDYRNINLFRDNSSGDNVISNIPYLEELGKYPEQNSQQPMTRQREPQNDVLYSDTMDHHPNVIDTSSGTRVLQTYDENEADGGHFNEDTGIESGNFNVANPGQSQNSNEVSPDQSSNIYQLSSHTNPDSEINKPTAFIIPRSKIILADTLIANPMVAEINSPVESNALPLQDSIHQIISLVETGPLSSRNVLDGIDTVGEEPSSLSESSKTLDQELKALEEQSSPQEPEESSKDQDLADNFMKDLKSLQYPTSLHESSNTFLPERKSQKDSDPEISKPSSQAVQAQEIISLRERTSLMQANLPDDTIPLHSGNPSRDGNSPSSSKEFISTQPVLQDHESIHIPRELLSREENGIKRKDENLTNASSSSSSSSSSSVVVVGSPPAKTGALTNVSKEDSKAKPPEGNVIKVSSNAVPSSGGSKSTLQTAPRTEKKPSKTLSSIVSSRVVKAKGSSTQPRQAVVKTATSKTPAINSLKGKTIISDIYEKGFTTPHEEVCPNNGRELRVLILVTSAPNHEKHRNAVRQTWGHFSMRKDVAIAFVVGRTERTDVQNVIDKENNRYGDIIEANFIDHYSNLTLKTVSMFEWARTYCSEAAFVLKTDDDMFINVPLLLAFISAKKKEKKVMFGRLAKGWKPIRNDKSKYYIDTATYSRTRYPDFVTGPAYLFTNDIVDSIYQKALKTIFFILEDVFLTGFVAESLGIRRVGDSHFRNEKIPLKDTCKLMQSISIHMVKYEEQFDIYKRTLDGKTKCKTR